MEIYEDAVAAIGETPLIRLARIHPPGNLVGKLEVTNPGGSIKDRIALGMVERAEREGLLRPGGTIVEPTSGNTGVGLAIVAALKGYRLICVMPDKVSEEKRKLLRAYGAHLEITPTEVHPEDPRSYYSVSTRLAKEIPGAYKPDQYSNPANPEAHYLSTGPEIWRQTDGEVDVLVAGVGTGGTITGTGRYLKEQSPEVEVVGVDPDGSVYTAPSPDDVHPYLVEGVGEDFWPESFDPSVVDRYLTVGDRESFAMAHRMARREGLLVGGSCGMAVHAAAEVAADNPGRLVVVILPDSGRGYLSKVFDDDWLRAQGMSPPDEEPGGGAGHGEDE